MTQSGRHGYSEHEVKFQITRVVVGFTMALSLLWLGLTTAIPREKVCTVDYYGPPNVTIMAENILQAQYDSYNQDYNYYRYIMNRDWDCVPRYDVYDKISDTMVDLLYHKLSKDDAFDIIVEQLETILTGQGIAELRLHWTMMEMDGIILDDDINIMIRYDATDEYKCQMAFNISTGYPYVRGDNLTCYVPAGANSCEHMSLEITGTMMGFYKILTKVIIYCWSFVAVVVTIALFSRGYRRIVKRRFKSFATSIGLCGAGDDNNDDDDSDDDQSSSSKSSPHLGRSPRSYSPERSDDERSDTVSYDFENDDDDEEEIEGQDYPSDPDNFHQYGSHDD